MTLTTQFLTMIAMIGMGSLFGALLDTYNRFLQRQKRKNWIVFINDLLFWILQGLSIFYVLFLVNEGEVRIYVFLALLCGFAAYQSLMKRIYLKTLEWLIHVTIATYNFIVRLAVALIFKPMRFLLLSTISFSILIGKGIFSLLKGIVSVVFWLLKVLWRPIGFIFILIWKALPKRFKNVVEKLYNKMAGINGQFKNYLVKIIKKVKSIIKK